MYTQNLHVHTTYCDGKNTPEELVQKAVSLGMHSIGFSGHSYMSFYPSISMSITGTEEYKKEIARLKEAYREKIEIFCGLEMEMYSECSLEGFDYLIGSVHYFNFNGEKVGMDRGADEVKRIIDVYFGGDGMAYAEEFYRQASLLSNYGKFDIIGHFDLLTKHSEKASFFDTASLRYRTAAIDALREVAKDIPLFEVNSGAIARGYRTTPYPAPFLLDECKRLGLGAVISSDCHNKEDLLCYFKESAAYLEAHGFRYVYVLTQEGFKPVKIEEFI